jgi:beta-lactamase class A
MPRTLRIATLFVVLLLILSACADATTQASSPATSAPPPTSAAPTTPPPTVAPPTATPTAPPQPTAVPVLASDVRVAGIDLGGLAPEAARQKLTDSLAALTRPLELRLGDQQLTLQPEDIAFEPALDDMLAQAQAAQPGTRVPLEVHYDEATLRAQLAELAKKVDLSPAITVITSTDTISRSFALAGGATLDIDAAIKQIDERLRTVGGARRVTLDLASASGAAARPAPEQLQEQIEAMAKGWKGVAGVYVYDLASGKQIAGLNERTAFTAASTIKVAIMLNLYINLPKLTATQQAALKKMIVESDNLKANDLLAAAAGGTATESAFNGAEQMSAMLAALGLKNTFLYIPFEAIDFIKLYNVKFKTGPKQGGEAPFTSASNTLRTTPYEIAQIYIYLEQCSRGEGVLLEKFSENLTAARCQEMIDWLKQNGDKTRMMSGLPKDVDAAHKSGWIPPQIQADAGIVYSPGGDFIVAIYLYQPTERYTDKVAQAAVGSFARLVYSYYNPITTK